MLVSVRLLIVRLAIVRLAMVGLAQVRPPSVRLPIVWAVLLAMIGGPVLARTCRAGPLDTTQSPAGTGGSTARDPPRDLGASGSGSAAEVRVRIGRLSGNASPGGTSLETGSIQAGSIQAGSIQNRGTSIPPAAARAVVRVLLFDSADAFSGLRDPSRVETFPADAAEFVLSDVAPGEYALLVHLDEDGDGQIDRNLLGIPVEPLAFSNDYRPRGPPIYLRARFVLAPGESRTFEMELVRPLGEWGRIGLGVGMIAATSPYEGANRGLLRVIPLLTYSGKRLQLLGPQLSYGLVGADRLRLAATARYRFGAYEERDSRILRGLGDRDDTVTAGLSIAVDLPARFDLRLGYEHDLLDRAGGGAARLSLSRPFQLGLARLSPRAGLTWQDAHLTRYDYGVPFRHALPGRPAYRPGESLNPELGVGLAFELTTHWRLNLDVGVQFLDREIQRSPIVDERRITQGFVALSYAF